MWQWDQNCDLVRTDWIQENIPSRHVDPAETKLINLYTNICYVRRHFQTSARMNFNDTRIIDVLHQILPHSILWGLRFIFSRSVYRLAHMGSSCSSSATTDKRTHEMANQTKRTTDDHIVCSYFSLSSSPVLVWLVF